MNFGTVFHMVAIIEVHIAHHLMLIFGLDFLTFLGRVGETIEFLERNEPVAVGIDLRHHSPDFICRDGAQCLQGVPELRGRDLAVLVGIEMPEDPLALRLVLLSILSHCSVVAALEGVLFGKLGFGISVNGLEME
ncbi:hypothetical protein RHSIM_Rhsim08G0086800 [Rhododendron simsii]|uniref:Uncharacterized protein n=1 Tax=Rhododendron simsii TaxID=118357 RepID=A0A834GLB0_RHOSS|nr:hypothetical protein RHSIM_Rhsim08G0086800 [Rhododendron simsii]